MFVSHHNISTDNWEEGNFAKTKKKKGRSGRGE
jgi:hypothetical protein